MHKIENLNILQNSAIITPSELKKQISVSIEADKTVFNSRLEIENILNGIDKRMFAIVGPCSIHSVDMALEYAAQLKMLSERVSQEILIVMRVYFEKPRTTVGWKGLINDPHLDDSFEVEEGLKIARTLMRDINAMSLPIGTEALDPISPQYLADLVSWSAIGARTTESQTHREMASGLSSPVGFKNGTDGSMSVALNAMLASGQKHAFLGINDLGQASLVQTRGNAHGHLILRGGTSGPNYEEVHIKQAEKELIKAGLSQNIVIDCSHGNSLKDYKRQSAVLENLIEQKQKGNDSIKGFMLESNLFEGQQKFTPGEKDKLEYGVSITDACLGWDETREIILKSAFSLSKLKVRN